MFAAADRAYIATKPYKNGRWSWAAGQFVVITEPEFLAVLAGDGMLDSLHEIDGAAFMGKAKTKAKDEPEAETAAAEPEAEPEAEAEDKSAAEIKPNATVVGGKVLGANRQHVRGSARK